MDVIKLTNPILTAEILMGSFRKMNPTEFNEAFNEEIRRGDEFTKLDDSEFTASLDESEATMYACHVQQFLQALNALKQSAHYQSIRGPELARTIALWQVVSTFKALHEKPTSAK